MGQAWVPIELPDFQVTKVIHSVKQIDIYAQSTIKKDLCPACKVESTKVHGSYERHLRDLPCQICSITLHIHVRRFVCQNPDCPRQTFTEETSRLAPHYARRTSRLTNWLKRIALALGGEAGARLTTYLGIATSGDTLLRILHKLPLPASPNSLHAIGIDDWAWRKGDSYGTIICDLVSNQVIDVLPDCEQDTIKTWLKVYPSLQFVSRDRSISFAKAIQEGAPQAIQVADRWHVLKNVREACQKVLSSH